MKPLILICFALCTWALSQGEASSGSGGEGTGLTVELNNGARMPLLGLGTWKSEPSKVKTAVYEAIKMGYRHIDCAWFYENEEEVGEGIAQAINEGIVQRNDLWITGKLWNTFHAAEQVEPHLRDSLAKLNLDYLDLYLIHWPCTDKEGPTLEPSIQETWSAMESIADKGLARTIGVSNFSVKKLRQMRGYARIFPAVNQIESHPLLRQDNLVRVCKELGTHVTAYSPLGSPDSAEMLRHDGASLLSHPVVVSVAAASGRTPGQVLLRWAVQRGTSVVPKASSELHLRENIVGALPAAASGVTAADYWQLSDEQMVALSSIDTQRRMISGQFFTSANGPYRTTAELWDEPDDNSSDTSEAIKEEL